MYIYKTTNKLNGKIYIGLSTKSVEESVDYLGSGTVIQLSIEKHGKENFIKEILEEGISNESLLCDLEVYWIKTLKSTDRSIGYNIHEGGAFGGWAKNFYNHPNHKQISKKLSESGKGRVVSEETKEKIRQSMIGKNTGNTSFKGRTHTKEALEKLSKAATGRKHSAESLKKISEASKGRVYKKVMCPRCKKEGAPSGMSRWHFDNCKTLRPGTI